MVAPAIRIDPRAEARFRQALELHLRGQIGQAHALYREALQIQPDHPEALHHLGIIALQSGDPNTAVKLIGDSIARNPGNPAAHNNLGMALEDSGQISPALESYERAIKLKPDYAEAILNRGNVLQLLGRWDDALVSYDRLVALAPRYADAFNNRGNVLRKLGRRREALESFRRAIALKPDFVQALSNCGVVLKDLREFDEAMRCFDKALALAPDQVDIINNRANALHEMDRIDEAIAQWNKAITLDHAFVEAYINRGNAFRELGRLDEAASSFEQALAIEPEHAGAQWTMSLLRLLRGDYEGGLPLYEARWRPGNALAVTQQRVFSQPRWDGTAPLAGRTILLHAEQGLGDTIQFCRYANRVAALGARVILEVQRPLLRLMHGLSGVSQVIACGDPLPGFDLHCPLLSLPMAMRTNVQDIPYDGPYLHATAGESSHWRARLGHHQRPKIGLVWSSGIHPGQPELWRINKRRDVPFDVLAGVNIPEMDYYGIQKGEPYEAQTDALRTRFWKGSNFFNQAPEIRDFADTAALIDNLDLVITVDTATAHLAGAMGKRAWVMLPFAADWRWLTEVCETAWYPSLRLFRQQQPGDWRDVVSRIREDLIAAPLGGQFPPGSH